ncbi:unnamed protein product [Polarella glacialis]|uniref:Uncharacterized protein n=1 Tax=Polarella glacialis TaxID=89957 RepID=A0A813IAN9_POLGL|nr:unnamed protein product [Polarella glacialis]
MTRASRMHTLGFVLPLIVASGQPLPAAYAALRLGEVLQTLPVSSTDVNAIAWFKYGLLQLLSFGYDYAGPAFVKSRENDPKFALAYAFEALNNFWPLWSKDDLAASNAIFSNIPGDATANHHEQLYIDAIRAHFNTSLENDTEARLSGAVTAIALVTESHPGDSTGWALLGLWRLVLSAKQDAAAAQSSKSLADSNLKSALAIDPRHPAALHYQLHLYDSLDAAVAATGLPAATLYLEVAQDASHGQHMPVHIQLRLANYSACFAADSLALQAADATYFTAWLATRVVICGICIIRWSTCSSQATRLVAGRMPRQ